MDMRRNMIKHFIPITWQRKAIARTDTIAIVVISIILLVFLINALLPRVGSRPLSPRTVCEANLRGIGQAIASYATDNSQLWPTPHFAETQGLTGVGKTSYVGELRKPAVPRNAPTTIGSPNVSVTRGFWILFRGDYGVTASRFICPLTKDTRNVDQTPEQYYDFSRLTEISYGMQVSFGPKGVARMDCDPNMPLAADKGPYSLVEIGKSAPDIQVAQIDTNSPIKKWQPFNSPNHNYEGQNVLFADGHAKFDLMPIAGIGRDNVYTRWSATPQSPLKDDEMIRGVSPSLERPNLVPMSNTDSLIYP